MSTQIKDESDKTYVVLGAPGSATSFVSKALEKVGVKMHNSKAKGKADFYEDRWFVRLNTRILQRAGGNWFNPPSEASIMEVDVDDEIKSKVAGRKSKYWGFKDPRTSLTAKKYLPHLKDDVYLICCFRKPEKVIKSWERSEKTESIKNKRLLVDKINRSIISTIEEFCEL